MTETTTPLYTADEFRQEIIDVTRDELVALGNKDAEIKSFSDILDCLNKQAEYIEEAFGEACTNIIENMVAERLKQRGIIDNQDLMSSYDYTDNEYSIDENFINACALILYSDCLKGPNKLLLQAGYVLHYQDFQNDVEINNIIASITSQIDGFLLTI
ncbi:hypothetical protein ACPA0F_18360 [Solibacillus silvestris]